MIEIIVLLLLVVIVGLALYGIYKPNNDVLTYGVLGFIIFMFIIAGCDSGVKIHVSSSDDVGCNFKQQGNEVNIYCTRIK